MEKNSMNHSFANKIQLQRCLNGFDITHMAKHMNISIEDYEKIENGEEEFTLDLLEKIAKAMGITMSEITRSY